jgi:hypothetical protein
MTDPRLVNVPKIDCYRQDGEAFELYRLPVIDYVSAAERRPDEWFLDPPPGDVKIIDMRSGAIPLHDTAQPDDKVAAAPMTTRQVKSKIVRR